ncbi:MAG: 4Fe-4S binding protein, partial [Candidatus Competibacteraceae bacterium]|nr:4Fe-4S binding protein [Candidatus Competibacteraceae bacterium]
MKLLHYLPSKEQLNRWVRLTQARINDQIASWNASQSKQRLHQLLHLTQQRIHTQIVVLKSLPYQEYFNRLLHLSQVHINSQIAVLKSLPYEEHLNRHLRLTQVRIGSQIVFFALFLFAVWATWTSRLEGYPVSRLLEMNPLVTLTTVLSTGYVYQFLGWGLLIIGLTFLFGRVFCNWICPFGTLHQFVGWLFNNKSTAQRIEQNRYHDLQYLKYSILIVFIILSALGALQIGLLDPIVIMYRAFTAVIAPATDGAMDIAVQAGLSSEVTDTLKFAPGVASRIFVGSFWIGLFFLFFVVMNLWKPRFFCRFLCPLGALLGSVSQYSLFRINRIVDRCTDCNLCLMRCEGASDPQSQVRVAECFSCMNCIDDCPEDALVFTLLNQDKQQVVPAPDVSKRRLLFAGAAGLATLPMLRSNGKSADDNFSPHMIRPPGSVAEP